MVPAPGPGNMPFDTSAGGAGLPSGPCLPYRSSCLDHPPCPCRGHVPRPCPARLLGRRRHPAASTAAQQANPFFAESPLPLHFPQFDKIKDSDFAPAFDAGMAQQLKEVEAIANNKAKPTFDNTIIALEKSGDVLDRATTVFFSLVGADTNDTRKKLQADYSARFAAHSDAIALNGKLFARIQALYDSRSTLGLDAEGVRLVEKYYDNYVRAGAKLSEADKAKLKDMNAELANLGTKFSQNVQSEVNASAITVDDVKELAGLSKEQIAAAAEAAKARGQDGKYVITLLNTTGQPPLTNLANRALRQKIYEASVSRGSRGGEFDNTALVSRIMQLRADKAKLMGFPNFAAYNLTNQTAKTPKRSTRCWASWPRPQWPTPSVRPPTCRR